MHLPAGNRDRLRRTLFEQRAIRDKDARSEDATDAEGLRKLREILFGSGQQAPARRLETLEHSSKRNGPPQTGETLALEVESRLKAANDLFHKETGTLRQEMARDGAETRERLEELATQLENLASELERLDRLQSEADERLRAEREELLSNIASLSEAQERLAARDTSQKKELADILGHLAKLLQPIADEDHAATE